MIDLIEDACTAGARLTKACQIVGLSPRTAQRYRQDGSIKPDGRKAAAVGRVPANRLSNEEREDILTTANQSQYAHLPPSQIVPTLADEGRYLASESTFYRVLREEKQLAHRGRVNA
ncbi:MAG: helix-turn-helix domain-containing protein, partial [Deltaproteobacteria bacterium]|nr:helix-turn-helix domain-containing protein [Deltaproteobacteria bacterium]